MSAVEKEDSPEPQNPPMDDKVRGSSELSLSAEKQGGSSVSASTVWSPFVLTWWIPAILFPILILAGIGLEIAYHFTKVNNGWPLPQNENEEYLHYVYTWIPVVAVMGIVTYNAAADYEIMKMQPYLDLAKHEGARGDTLLLDYTSKPKFLVWILQIHGGHLLAAISTIMVLLLLTLQPLASSLLVVKDTEFRRDPIGVPKFGVIGINDTFSTLQGFASAAGFAEADARYKIGRPPFVWRAWAIDEFLRPTSFISNGTMQVNTTAIRTLPNCVAAEQISYTTGAAGDTLTGSWQGCTFSRTFTDSDGDATHSGVDVTRNCTSSEITSLEDPFKPVVFWFASNSVYTSAASLVFCSPKLSLHNVTVTVNLATGQMIDVVSLADYDIPTNVTSGPPLNGQVFNGVEFDTTDADADTLLRANMTQLQLPASIFHLLQSTGLDTVLQNPEQVVNITTDRYQLFLALSARSNYFITDTSGTHLPAYITEIQQRLWMSTLSVHLMAVVLIVTGLLGGTLHYMHSRERKKIKLFAEPGSIAVTATATKDSPLFALVDHGMDQSKLRSALQKHKFTVDSRGRIILADGQ